ncbi:MAG: DUF3488 and transglutaminase-like domain-containing protein [Propionibacteriaceae bacterium]|jgi:transglutaminase-like putative cysteine protease|nr:DUF3488 and transglutaminase-like domain-containing protein [Propionibacteriaceae bacterium]
MAKTRATTPAAAVDAVAVIAMLGIILTTLWPAFGGAVFLRPVASGLALGVGIAWLGAWRRWPAWLIAGVVVGAYFVFGAAAALWRHAIAGLVPNLSTLHTLVFGSFGVWRQFVTASTPLGSFYGFMLVPFILALLAGVVTATLAWRVKRTGLALIPVAVTAAAAILLGTVDAFYPVIQALAVAVIAIAWLTWRGMTGTRQAATASGAAARRSRVLKAGVLTLAAALVAGGAGHVAFADGLDRQVIRRYTVPPLDTHAYASPLISFRDLVDAKAEDTLFTVEGWNTDYRLRLAVMDTFDGMVYNVGEASGASRYDRTGPELGAAAAAGSGTDATVTVTVKDYTGVWVPTLSVMATAAFAGARSDALTENLYYNPASDALIDTSGLGSGVVLTLTARVPDTRPTYDTPVAQRDIPKPAWVPDAVSSLASKWAGTDKSALKRIDGIIQTLQTTGYFSHGLESEEPSKPGHSSFRIAELLDKPERMIGDDEQYAVAAALMLLDAGLPARVVMGFHTDAESQVSGTTWDVRGSDVHAWVEVPFDGVGWVAFDPTPDKNQEPKQQEQQSKAKPKPQVLQPPPPANEAGNDTLQSAPDPRTDDNKDKEKDTPVDWARIILIAAAIGGSALLLIGPWIVLLLIKTIRTARRRKTPDPARRIALGWQEVLDHAADLGLAVPPAATRLQASQALARARGVTGLDALARWADQSVFAPVAPAAAEAQTFWSGVKPAAKSLARTATRRRRLAARFSWNSLRKHPKPTVEIE